MCSVAMESRCMKTVRAHVVHKSDFMLSDHNTRCKSFQQFYLSSQSLRTVIFSALRLPSRIFKSTVNTSLAKKLAPYFARWCVSGLLTCCAIFIPELLRIFEIFSTFAKQR